MQANRRWLSTDFALSALWLPGLVSWSLMLNCWRVTWRGDTGRLLLTLQPQMTVLSVQRHWLWRVNLRNFDISQYLARTVWRALDVSPFSFTLVVPEFRIRSYDRFFWLHEQYSCSDTHTCYSSIFIIVTGHKPSNNPTQSQIFSYQSRLQPPKYNSIALKMEVVRWPETFYLTWCLNAEYCLKQIRVHPRQGHEGPEGGVQL
jgi:hypothetical protein